MNNCLINNNEIFVYSNEYDSRCFAGGFYAYRSDVHCFYSEFNDNYVFNQSPNSKSYGGAIVSIISTVDLDHCDFYSNKIFFTFYR